MRLPEWIRPRLRHSELRGVKNLLRTHGLSTVCEEARCPNKAECFSRPTATFMILGASCTRSCGFCAVDSSGPALPDLDEPARVAEAAREMGLRYVVVTSVTRDDLADGGAGQFAATVGALKASIPGVRVEVLTPDFKGDRDAVKTVLDAAPDVFNHNVETVPRLYSEVRPQADYSRSLGVLSEAKRIAPGIPAKSGMMLGLGETFDEVVDVMRDLRRAGCDFLTVGQYLRPSRRNLPVKEYVPPERFDEIRGIGLEMGFRFVASSPLVRSSMNAEEMYDMEQGAANVRV